MIASALTGLISTSVMAGFDEGAKSYCMGDVKSAFTLWEASAKNNDLNSQLGLAKILLNNEVSIVKSRFENPSEEMNKLYALGWLELAAKQNSPVAQYRIGRFHEEGLYKNGKEVIKRSDEEALEWYKKAADQNHQLAMYKVVEFYRYIKGMVYPNYIEEKKWGDRFRKNEELNNYDWDRDGFYRFCRSSKEKS